MVQDFAPEVPPLAVCKCCGGAAPLCGVVDFNKNCEAARQKFPLPLIGIPVYYHRCSTCGLIFTTRFDHFSKADFAEHIYNDDYRRVDPDYLESRPVAKYQSVCSMFVKTPGISILDYGCGNGKLATMLRLAGFSDVTGYDPFVPEFATLPQRKFQLVLAYEVMEHSPRPVQTLEEMASLRAEDGIIIFSTLAQPPNIDQIGLNWWYCSPRNGHVTLFSMQSLQLLADRVRLRIRSTERKQHVLFANPPEFARHLIGPT